MVTPRLLHFFTRRSLWLALLPCLLVRAYAAPAPVSFKRDIAPLLADKCLTCHNEEKAKGKYRLHTFAALQKGGSSGDPALTPGQPTQSAIYKLLLEKNADDRMPQNADALPAKDIALIERWIKEGAHFDGDNPATPLVGLIPKANQPQAPAIYPFPVPVDGLAFLPGGQELAVSGYHEVTIWNATNGVLVRRLGGLDQQVHRLSAHPTQPLIAAAIGNPGRRGEVVLLDANGKIAPRTLAVLPDVALDVAFSPDGSRLLAGGSDNTIRIFDTATGKEQLKLEQHSDWVTAVTWSADGSQFATASRDKTSRSFTAATGQLEATFAELDSYLFAVAFASDGKNVLCGGRDRTIQYWKTEDGKKNGHIEDVEPDVLQILIRNDFAYVASSDARIRIYRISDHSLVKTLTGHKDWVQSLAWNEATQRLASGSHDGEVRLWNLADNSFVFAFPAIPGRVTAQAH